LAIADAYDVMIHGRVYKAACNCESALVELKKNAGTQFDPEIVDLFIKTCKWRIRSIFADMFAFRRLVCNLDDLTKNIAGSKFNSRKEALFMSCHKSEGGWRRLHRRRL